MVFSEAALAATARAAGAESHLQAASSASVTHGVRPAVEQATRLAVEPASKRAAEENDDVDEPAVTSARSSMSRSRQRRRQARSQSPRRSSDQRTEARARGGGVSRKAEIEALRRWHEERGEATEGRDWWRLRQRQDADEASGEAAADYLGNRHHSRAALAEKQAAQQRGRSPRRGRPAD